MAGLDPVAMRAAPEAAVAQTPSTTSAARRRTEEQPRMQAEEGKRDWEGMEEVLLGRKTARLTALMGASPHGGDRETSGP